MYSSIMLGVALVIIVLCAGISALRGFSKSGLRCATILISALAAVITCLILKAQLPSTEEFVIWIETNMETIRQNLGGDMSEMLESVLEFSKISPTLVELVLQIIGALLAPLLCLILFFVYCLITGIIYFIVKLILRGPMKLLNHSIGLSRLWAAAIGVLEGVIIVAMIFLPVSGYMSVVKPTMDGLVQQEIMDAEDPDTKAVLDVIDEIDSAPVLTVYRGLGGEALADSMMSMKVAGQSVSIKEELNPVLGLLMNITELGETPMENYGEREAELIRAIATSFNESKLLAPIVGDILYAATDSWLNGEEFLGMPKPDMGDAAELFGPFVDTFLEIVHDDAKTAALLQKDIQTLADVIAILVKSDVMANLENTEALLSTLGGNGVIESMITTLGENDSMKRLIPEVTNLGVRAIGQVLNIPQDVEAVYGEFMDEVADALNDVSSLSGEEQVEVLTERLNTAFDEAGVAIDGEILDFYSASMISDLVENNTGDVTSADVQAFFLLYADKLVENSPSASAGYPRVEVLSQSQNDLLAGTVYANMTQEQLSNTATAKLAALCFNLSRLDANANDFSEQAKALVTETFTEILGEDHAALEALKNTELKGPVSTESIQNAASMKSSDAMEKTTTVVTLQQLLIDTKAAAENLNAGNIQKEAEAIGAIFGTAGNLMNSLTGGSENFNLNDVAGAMGTILDSMKNTDSFGKDKTANLFTAVMQSNTVRDAAGLDKKTATEMANKANSGDGNYSDTMNTVAGSMDIVDKIKNNEDVSDEQLVDLIQNLTPQTAGMLEVFMNGDRMVKFGVPAKNADTAAELVSSIFSYMAGDNIENYDKEAKALKQVLQMALTAKDSNKKPLFSSTENSKDGKLPHPEKMVEALLDSKAIVYALNDDMTDGTRVTNSDPFGLGVELDKPQNEKCKADLQKAIDDHRRNNSGVSNLTYEALEALFGLR